MSVPVAERRVGRPAGSLEPGTVLQCAPGVETRIDSGIRVGVYVNGGRIDGGPHTLRILDEFLRPRRVDEGLASLSSDVTGVQDWIEVTSGLVRLYDSGVLRPPDALPARAAGPASSFDSAPNQAVMLSDRVRTGRFMDAVRKVVRPGDVVVEIGTGTGILSITAARAGASRVYAIEAGSMAKVARKMFEANRVADRVTLLEGWSSRIELPERADVLVAEIVGNDPLGEGILEFTTDAVQRLLRPGARMVPGELSLWALPVGLPDRILDRRSFTPRACGRWASWYDLDFAPLVDAARGAPHSFLTLPQSTRDWIFLGEPVLLSRIVLSSIPGRSVDVRTELDITESGRLDGLLVYFELEMGDGSTFSVHPELADDQNCWSVPVWLFPDGPLVDPGDSVPFSFRRCLPGAAEGALLEPQTEMDGQRAGVS